MFVDSFATHRSDDAAVRLSARNADAVIVIGLVNIMPPTAMRTIENLFRCLLNAVASRYKIHLRFFSPHVGPIQTGKNADPIEFYESLDGLWDSPNSDSPLDALIITGTESRAPLMTDELCWPDLQKICDWAGDNTISTIWSCFSAHAAVLHMDNIHRQALSEKLTGIFECEKASDHPLFKNMPSHWSVPHSRYNGLNAAELEAKGYEILSQSPLVGADSFIKRHNNSEFLFLQGHLEYGTEMLFSEYCRDLKRFAQGKSANYPTQPKNYFDQTAMEVFAAAENSIHISLEALSSAEFVHSVTAQLNNDWQEPARQVFSAWLTYIGCQKTINNSISGPFSIGALKALSLVDTHGHIAHP